MRRLKGVALRELPATRNAAAVCIGIVVVAMAAAAVGYFPQAGSSIESLRFFRVSFSSSSEFLGSTTGFATYGSSTTFSREVSAQNLTLLEVKISWNDRSLSPLSDPLVSVSIVSPEGVRRQETSVPQDVSVLIRFDLNQIPDDVVVESGDEDQAKAQAMASEVNPILGVGTWNWTLEVGYPTGGGARLLNTVDFESEWRVEMVSPASQPAN